MKNATGRRSFRVYLKDPTKPLRWRGSRSRCRDAAPGTDPRPVLESDAVPHQYVGPFPGSLLLRVWWEGWSAPQRMALTTAVSSLGSISFWALSQTISNWITFASSSWKKGFKPLGIETTNTFSNLSLLIPTYNFLQFSHPWSRFFWTFFKVSTRGTYIVLLRLSLANLKVSKKGFHEFFGGLGSRCNLNTIYTTPVIHL